MRRPSRSLILLVVCGCSALFAASPPKQDKKDPEENLQRLDAFGDPLPEGAKSRLGTLRFRHDGEIEALAFSPDGKWIAALSNANNVCVWDIATGKKKYEFRPEVEDESWNPVLAFSAEGTKLTVIGNQGQVQRWDMASGKKTSAWQKEELVGLMAFSADGETILSLHETEIDKTNLRLWEAATGKVLRTIAMKDETLLDSDDEEGSLPGVALSRDGKILAIRESGGFRLRDLKKDKEITFIKHKDEEETEERAGLAITPDNKYLVAAETANKVFVWNIHTGKKVKSWKYPGEIRSLTLSPNGKLLAVVEAEGVVRLRDFNTGKILHTLASCGPVLFSPDGKTLAAGINTQGITLWDLATGQPFPDAHPGMITGLAFTPDGKTVLTAGGFSPVERGDAEGTGDGEVRSWDAATGKALAKVKYEGAVVGFGCTEAGKLLACLQGNTDAVRLVDLDSMKELAKWDLLNQNLLSANGKILARRDQDGQVIIFDVEAGKDVLKFPPGDEVQFLALSWDGKFLAGEGPETGTLYLWDTTTGKRLQRFSREMKNAEEEEMVGGSVGALSSDGRFLALGGVDGSIWLWEAATHREIGQIKGHQGMISALAFSPDGRKLASGSADTTALVWDVAEVLKGNFVQRTKLSSLKVEELWQSLESGNGGKAYQAFWTLVSSPDRAIPFLKDRLRPVPRVDDDKIRTGIANLSDNQFIVREQARKDLEQLGELAEPLMRQALKGKVDPEAKRRLENLLGSLDGPVLPPRLGSYRALGLLEQIGTAEARELLNFLAEGAPGARQTNEAKEALARLAKMHIQGRVKITSK